MRDSVLLQCVCAINGGIERGFSSPAKHQAITNYFFTHSPDHEKHEAIPEGYRRLPEYLQETYDRETQIEVNGHGNCLMLLRTTVPDGCQIAKDVK